MVSGSRVLPLSPRRYLGLELSGAKNQKTALAVLEYYPKEQKIFLLDVYDRIERHEEQSGDEALLDTIREIRGTERHTLARMGVNVPLTLPPCLTCTRKTCPTPAKCTVPTVKWMRDQTRRAARDENLDLRVLEFTPYTQRPVELWVRYQVLAHLPAESRFEVDEAMGGNKAALTARMNYLQRHLPSLSLVEVWPKLSISLLAPSLGLPRRILNVYRTPETGIAAREEILEAIIENRGVFIYDRDVKKLAHSLASFDAFVCAYTALLSDQDQTVQAPHAFPSESGWVEYPTTRKG